jgi:predicted transcriptional regulator
VGNLCRSRIRSPERPDASGSSRDLWSQRMSHLFRLLSGGRGRILARSRTEFGVDSMAGAARTAGRTG